MRYVDIAAGLVLHSSCMPRILAGVDSSLLARTSEAGSVRVLRVRIHIQLHIVFGNHLRELWASPTVSDGFRLDRNDPSLHSRMMPGQTGFPDCRLQGWQLRRSVAQHCWLLELARWPADLAERNWAGKAGLPGSWYHLNCSGAAGVAEPAF